MSNNFPKLHNATWPGIVGKGADSEPPIPFDTMLEMTAAAEAEGQKFDGIDIGLLDPHINIDSTEDDIKRLVEKVGKYNLNIGSLVAPIWGGPAMGSKDERTQFVEMVRKACEFGKHLRNMGIRPYGVIRIDSASSPENWDKDPENNTNQSNPRPTQTIINTKLMETIINPDSTELPPTHLGWNGRLNGPVDNPMSSCYSCHATAEYPTGSPLSPLFDGDSAKLNPPGSLGWMRWFQNNKCGTPFDGPTYQSTDFCLQITSFCPISL